MSEIYDEIVHKYRQEILDYCYSRLKNYQAAEDCTQEVFFVFFRKIALLDLSVNIRNWLYSVAEREIKAYRRSNPDMVDINEIPEQPDETADLQGVDVPDELTELTNEERLLISDYYSGENADMIAVKYGISIPTLYVRVHRIKQKLKLISGNEGDKNE